MSGDSGLDMMADLVLGQPRPFVDPETGEVVMEHPITLPRKRKAADGGYVLVNMEAVRVAAQHLNGPAMFILLEAARQWRMGNGAVAVTSALCERLNLSRKRRRGVVEELAAFALATSWVKVTQSNHQATRLQITTEGMRRLWRETGRARSGGGVYPKGPPRGALRGRLGVP